MEMRVTSTTRGGMRLEHKHGLDEWSPMMPERSGQTVVPGEEQREEIYRCQRIGCTEVVRVRPDEATA